MLFYKAFSIMFAQLGTPSTWCSGQLLFTPFNASGYSNSEIVEKALKWGKLPNGLEVVLLDKSLVRLIDWKGLLHILQFFPRFNLLHLLQVALALQKGRVKNHILAICCHWAEKAFKDVWTSGIFDGKKGNMATKAQLGFLGLDIHGRSFWWCV